MSTSPWFERIERLYVINLERRKDRREHMRTVLDQWCIPPEKVTLVKAVDNVTKPFQGCTESHLKALHHASEIESKKPFLILEDDVQLRDPHKLFGFHTQMEKIMSQQHEWDVFQLASNIIKAQEIEDQKPFIKIETALTTAAYLVSNEYLEKLIESYKTSLKEERPLDLDYQFLQKRDRWWSSKPTLLVQQPGYSDIEKKMIDYSIYDT